MHPQKEKIWKRAPFYLQGWELHVVGKHIIVALWWWVWCSRETMLSKVLHRTSAGKTAFWDDRGTGHREEPSLWTGCKDCCWVCHVSDNLAFEKSTSEPRSKASSFSSVPKASFTDEASCCYTRQGRVVPISEAGSEGWIWGMMVSCCEDISISYKY